MLKELLKSKFGFDDFRPSQELVCQTVASGQDALLVMPTGAGKSLCYQLPGLARGGVTLVISPLLALIDDQVAKLRALGLRAEQIHSGRSREESRNACIRYLQGELDFLFIAPERLAVRGFPEMLQKRKPTLIAIDEAHCISQWGHDFRPEYRKLGERLAGLRPAPLIALTATATPVVQDDIIKQLAIPEARRFIQGFRRTNIAIQVHEVPLSSRGRACIRLLEGKTPAIVYATTRRAADEIATELKGHFRAEAYHAGMTPDARESAQTRFLSGKFEVIVATVAFGMGIDKADVRTVIHAGLPGSVEGYYQEIGRAGRDGKPSSAILLHAFSDQKTHGFFFERDYPESNVLQKIFKAATVSPRPKEDIRERIGKGITNESFEKALEKLWIHGGVLVDPEENVIQGHAHWQNTYEQQRSHRSQSLEKMTAFTRHGECRMLFFLKHFGDTSDKGGSCKSCDRCSGTLVDSRIFNDHEHSIAAQILACLFVSSGSSVGRLYDETVSGIPGKKTLDRKTFESVLDVLVQAKWLSLRQESFEKDGKKISYRKIEVEKLGEYAKSSDLKLLRISASPWAPETTPGSRSRPRKKAARKLKPGSKVSSKIVEANFSETHANRLRQWRLKKAREQGIPAFRIFSDQVLQTLAENRPSSLDELLEVRGFGPKLRDKYGREILECLQ